jgi:hypothetical protein
MKRYRIIAIVAALAAAASLFTASAQDAKKEKRPYTLDVCPVSDEKLGEMGKPFEFLYKDPKIKDDPGREIKFCCESCVKDFKKEPAKYLKKIDEAEAKAKAKAPPAKK